MDVSSGSIGLVLAAGGIAVANEVVFAPLAGQGKTTALQAAQGFNWRIIPATLILAATLRGLETVAPGFARGLAGLVVLSVLIIPVGTANPPLTNIAKVVTTGTKPLGA